MHYEIFRTTNIYEVFRRNKLFYDFFRIYSKCEFDK